MQGTSNDPPNVIFTQDGRIELVGESHRSILSCSDIILQERTHRIGHIGPLQGKRDLRFQEA